jgi:hypothetical protein
LILTADEYSKGFVDFDAVLPEGCTVELWIRTANTPEEDDEWTGPYSEPSGCKILAPAKQYFQLRMNLKRGEDPTKSPIVKGIRIDRAGQSYIWPGPRGFNGPPKMLRLGRDYGCSYRLIFRPQKAIYPESLVLIKDKMRIRFWKEGIIGYEISGFQEKILDSDGRESIEGGGVKEVTFEGDIVEILATVAIDDEAKGMKIAKMQVESIMGLLALCFGGEILGEILSEEYHFSNASGEQGAVPIPVQPKELKSIDKDSASFVDNTLTELFLADINPSANLALRWYAKGLLSTSTADAFIAYFIGIEALASGYFASITPAPIRDIHEQLERYLEKSQPPIDPELRQTILERVEDFPLNDKFNIYWKACFQGAINKNREFSKLKRIRDAILHGSAQVVTPAQTNSARTLLENLLGYELKLSSLINERQAGPKVFEIILRYALTDREKSLGN